MRKIKANITREQFDILIRNLRSDIDIRDVRKDRLLKMFNLLYYTGIRINEATQITNVMMVELISNRKLIIKSHKQDIEKLIYLTDNGCKLFKRVFKDIDNNDDLIFVSERNNKKTKLESSSVIRDVNTYIRKIFGKDCRITSHSFRQSLITELSRGGINTKVIQNLVSHQSISTTYRYIKTSEVDLTASLNSIR